MRSDNNSPSRHTPETWDEYIKSLSRNEYFGGPNNARNLGTPTPAAYAEREDNFLPEILQPSCDSEEQERKVKMTIILEELDRLHAAATAGEWVSSESWVATTGPVYGDIICDPPEYWEQSMRNWPNNRAWIITAHNHYPALREEIRRLREEVKLLREQLDASDTNHRYMAKELATAKRDGAAEYPDELEACKPYLKDGESPAECIARNRADVATMLRALGVAKLRAEKAESRIAELESQLATAKRNGAIEELRRLAKELDGSLAYSRDGYVARISARADELEGKNATRS